MFTEAAPFCDVAFLTPLSATGEPRSGTSKQCGSFLEHATAQNYDTYIEVIAPGLGQLLCLGNEVYGRWSQQCVDLIPALARERCRGLHPRIRRGVALFSQHRGWGLVGVGFQKAVAHAVLNVQVGADLLNTQLEPVPPRANVVS